MSGGVQAPPLSCGDAVDEPYRLLRTPSNRPAGVITLSRHEDGWDLASVEFVDPLKSKPRPRAIRCVIAWISFGTTPLFVHSL
jgi:hypothetical protein